MPILHAASSFNLLFKLLGFN